jgi:retinol-binding protein 3
VHLWDQYSRPGNDTRQVWTLPFISGKRYLGKDVYLLTSKDTFSAAEGFAYTLKNMKRATVIGETTAGGAHPGDMQWISEHFALFVPTGRIISPITKKDWEGTGVMPDVKVPMELALPTAYLDGVKRLADKWKDDPILTDQFKKIRERLENEVNRRNPKELKTPVVPGL